MPISVTFLKGENVINIPTALTLEETRFLQSKAQGKRVVEGGPLLGYSTVAMAQAGARVTSIDLHEGYPRGNPRSTLQPFLSNLQVYGVRDKVEVKVGDVRELVKGVDADLALIDLNGKFGLTRDALRALKTRVALVHDAGRQSCRGVMEAIRHEGWRVVEGVGTFVLIEK